MELNHAYMAHLNILFKSTNSIMLKYKGNRLYMEDYHVSIIYKDIQVYGIFDGHGGHFISKTLPTLLQPFHELIYQYSEKNINKKTLYKQLCSKSVSIDRYYIGEHLYKNQGSTLHLVYITRDSIIIINIGDSKSIIIGQKAMFETIQHRPSNSIEYNRIVKSGHSVDTQQDIARIDNTLSVSRSFGDFAYKYVDNKYNGIHSAVSIQPDIYTISKTPNSYMIIASDGLWDNISNGVIQYLMDTYSTNIECLIKQLLNKALIKGANDNITIIVVKL